MKRAIVGCVALAAALIAMFITGAAGAQHEADAKATGTAKSTSNVFIVLLDEAPVAAYQGGVAGYPATKPAAGKKLNKNDSNVQKYAGYLGSRHGTIANGVGATRIYDYVYSLNGFAAVLNKSQVAKLQATKGVVAVKRDSLSQPQTDNTPTFLGLNAGGGIWSQLGGQSQAGTDVIVGVVDTGVWPEHPSFAGTGYGPPPAGWNGECESGEQWTKANCNNKLIGARYFNKGFGHFGGQLSGDFQSARDHEGHGTHTASTAGGNSGVAASILGRSFGTISGMAPRARIAAYKACWPGGCAVSDLVEAIDTAVADGVDVINYSIGDNDPDFLDADDVAFLFARQAGVFVSASAGNSGPDPSTVDHGGPWLTTVGASTHSRSWVGTVTLGNGQTFKGVQVTGPLASTALVDGAASGSEGCLTGLNPALVTGKIVLCEGSFSRAARSRAVKDAGGVGMILYTASEFDTLMSDTHHVPTVHVRTSAGTAIRAYIDAPGASTASLSGVSKELGGGNVMAAFSSRGPLLANARSTGDLLKPDITAPGVQVLAGNSPVETNAAPGQLFQSIGGTSMSSPHIAGIGALLKDLHPDWTPAEMQSAIMTSARQNVVKQDGVTPADPFDFGAGHVVPNGAANPGLVYPVAFDDYRAFLRSQGLCTNCFGTGPAPVVAATDLNVPSVTIRSLVGVKTVTRKVRNVGPAGTYTVDIVEPVGVDVTVTPRRLTLAAGATATYQIAFAANEDALFDEYSFGSVTWADRGGHQARIPLVIRPVAIAAPAELTDTGRTSGSLTRTVQLGYQGPFAVAAEGLLAATTETRTVVDDPTNNFDTDAPDSNQGIQVHSFTVPAGTTLARFQLFDEFTDGEDDLDLYLYHEGTLVGTSAGATAAERIDLGKPAAGAYKLYVHGWQTDGTNAVYTLFDWFVPSTAAGNMTVTSSTSSATVGGTANITASWSGLTAGTKYLGRIRYSSGASEIGSTIVSINP